MEIVLPGAMTVMESHDLALELQHKLEALEDVERAFVHVDHQERDGLEHKTERELADKSAKNNIDKKVNLDVELGEMSRLDVIKRDGEDEDGVTKNPLYFNV